MNKVAQGSRPARAGDGQRRRRRGRRARRRVRQERRALMKRLGWLPVTASDFSKRDESGDRQWNRVSQALQELTVEADKLGAIINGLKRVHGRGLAVRRERRSGVARALPARDRGERTRSRGLSKAHPGVPRRASTWAARSPASAISVSSRTIRSGGASARCSRVRSRSSRPARTRATPPVTRNRFSRSLARADTLELAPRRQTRAELERSAAERADVLRKQIADEVVALETQSARTSISSTRKRA